MAKKMVRHRGSVATVQQRSGSIYFPPGAAKPPALVVNAGPNVKLEPWKPIRSAESAEKSVGGLGAGTWISPTGALRGSICPAVDGGIAFCIAPTFSAPAPQTGPVSPKIRSSCVRTQRLVLAYRDKESLIEEVKDLRKALREQADYFKVHKLLLLVVLASDQSGTLRAMDQTIEDSFRRPEKHEIKVERDIFAEEIGRLQRLIEHLKLLRDYVVNENKKLARVRDKVIRLEIANQHLEGCISVVQETLKKAHSKIETCKIKTKEYQTQAGIDGDKCKGLQSQADSLEAELSKERFEKLASEKRVNYLKRKLWKAEHDLAELDPKQGKVDGSCQVNYPSPRGSPSPSTPKSVK
ncbi:hypothetical protein SELMODRAFT_415769 [Selaginella moellendorffii]|uniref:Uncharacterized protein n=1 Tax=Selaginella moellendorffii TaxID=88036 RepID=D8RX67_SELML|nr:hypothetical protein SELMODRAFT_415769 [Selaginella moellendorffii]